MRSRWCCGGNFSLGHNRRARARSLHASSRRPPAAAKLRPAAAVTTKYLCIAAVLSPAPFPAAAARHARPTTTYTFYYVTCICMYIEVPSIMLRKEKKKKRKYVFHLFLFYSHVVFGTTEKGWQRRWRRSIIFVSPIKHMIAFRATPPTQRDKFSAFFPPRTQCKNNVIVFTILDGPSSSSKVLRMCRYTLNYTCTVEGVGWGENPCTYEAQIFGRMGELALSRIVWMSEQLTHVNYPQSRV